MCCRAVYSAPDSEVTGQLRRMQFTLINVPQEVGSANTLCWGNAEPLIETSCSGRGLLQGDEWMRCRLQNARVWHGAQWALSRLIHIFPLPGVKLLQLFWADLSWSPAEGSTKLSANCHGDKEACGDSLADYMLYRRKTNSCLRHPIITNKCTLWIQRHGQTGIERYQSFIYALWPLIYLSNKLLCGQKEKKIIYFGAHTLVCSLHLCAFVCVSVCSSP